MIALARTKPSRVYSHDSHSYSLHHVSLFVFLYIRSRNVYIFNNYSPKWRWLAADIYRAAKRRGKYPALATDTEVNSCFSIY